MLVESQLNLLVLLPKCLILLGEPLIVMIDASEFLLHYALALPDLAAVLLISLPGLLLERAELVLDLVDLQARGVSLNAVLVGRLFGIREFQAQVTNLVVQRLQGRLVLETEGLEEFLVAVLPGLPLLFESVLKSSDLPEVLLFFEEDLISFLVRLLESLLALHCKLLDTSLLLFIESHPLFLFFKE